VQRRMFVKAAIGAAMNAGIAAASSGDAEQASSTAAGEQQFYQLRRYALRNGPQTTLTQNYFEHALIPALGRLQMGPVGAFKLDVGPEMPVYYLLVSAYSAEAIATLDSQVAADAEYVKAAAGFRDAPAAQPAFERMEQTVLAAFARWPRLTPTKSENGKLPRRIFQLRTYESPNQAAHLRKVAMFNEAEIGIFTRNGLAPVFFGKTLIGNRMPSLTYMLTFTDTAELTARWAAFSADPEWRDLSRRPGNTDPEIVSNISNLYLSPLACSQI
jgi:hypothetical protein